MENIELSTRRNVEDLGKERLCRVTTINELIIKLCVFCIYQIWTSTKRSYYLWPESLQVYWQRFSMQRLPLQKLKVLKLPSSDIKRQLYVPQLYNCNEEESLQERKGEKQQQKRQIQSSQNPEKKLSEIEVCNWKSECKCCN